MSKTITVWGNPGCGKSMFCCNLAKVLTANKEKALIINADSSTPMLPVWMPERILETNASIGNVLTGLEINTALVAERVTILKEYPFIGVMGYAAGENPFSYPELKYDKIKLFIGEAAKLVDYIILDCSSNMLNFFTPTAIEAADVVLMDDDVRKIAAVVRISRRTLAIVKQNIVFALGVKALVLLLGAFGMANMWEAVFADVGVSVIAILNAMRALKAE